MRENLCDEYIRNCQCCMVPCWEGLRPLCQSTNTIVYLLSFDDLVNWMSTPTQSNGPATGIGMSSGVTAHRRLHGVQTMQALHHLTTSFRIVTTDLTV